MTVHTIGEVRVTCKECGEEFPCRQWVARTRAEVEPAVWPQTIQVYREHASEEMAKRMEAALTKEMSR